MPRLTRWSALLFSSLLLAGCKSKPAPVETKVPNTPAKTPTGQPTGASITQRLSFDCFEAGLMRTPEKPATCEPSAILWQDGTILVGNDKPIPGDGNSPIFSLTYTESSLSAAPTKFMTHQAVSRARKYEDFTITTDGAYILASTGFDRVMKDKADQDPYSTLLYWPKDQPQSVKVANPSTRDEIESSQFIREKLSLALKDDAHPHGMPYFKVEALVAIPGNILLFGIREWGENYETFNYSTRMVAASYTLTNGTLALADDFREVYSFDTSVVPEKVAISSLAYDASNDQLYILTSYETGHDDEGVGGYLWRLPMADFKQGKAPELVKKADTTPLRFAHKAEGVSVVDANTVVVVHDDDRVVGRKEVTNPETQFSRALNQGFIDIVKLP